MFEKLKMSSSLLKNFIKKRIKTSTYKKSTESSKWLGKTERRLKPYNFSLESANRK
jgi:hypothetical protein